MVSPCSVVNGRLFQTAIHLKGLPKAADGGDDRSVSRTLYDYNEPRQSWSAKQLALG